MFHSMHAARIKKMIGLAVDPDLLRRLEKWRLAQDVPPSKTAVHETALREFLERREASSKGRR
jgi:predicted transcriptional regulator